MRRYQIKIITAQSTLEISEIWENQHAYAYILTLHNMRHQTPSSLLFDEQRTILHVMALS